MLNVVECSAHIFGFLVLRDLSSSSFPNEGKSDAKVKGVTPCKQLRIWFQVR